MTHRQTFRLPLGFRCTFTYGTAGLSAEWEPWPPTGIRSARARRKFRAAYEAARNQFLKDVATIEGGNVAVVDLDGGMTVIEPGRLH